jgi:hypothetical protein
MAGGRRIEGVVSESLIQIGIFSCSLINQTTVRNLICSVGCQLQARIFNWLALSSWCEKNICS